MTKLKVLLKQMMLFKKAHRILYVYMVIYILCAGIFPVLSMIIPRYIIHQLETQQLVLNDVFLYLIKIGGLMIVTSIGMHFIWGICIGIFSEMRWQEFKKLNRFMFEVDYANIENPKWIDDFDRASQTLNNDMEGFQGTYTFLLEGLGILMASMIYMYIIAKVHILFLVIMLVTSILVIYFNSLKRKKEFEYREPLSRYRREMKYYSDTLQDVKFVKDVRIYNLFSHLSACYKGKLDQYISLFTMILSKQFSYSLLEIAVTFIQDVICFSLLIYLTTQGQLLLGDFTLCLSSMIALNSSLMLLGQKVGKISQWLSLTQEFYQFMEKYTPKTQHYQLMDIETPNIEIEFKNVTFKYPNTQKNILTNFNLKIKAGEKLAIVGINGAGKSTLIKLLTGLFKPDQGEILVNGKSISNYNPKEYQKIFGVVFQDFQILNLDVYQNVAMASTSKVNEPLVKQVIDEVGLKEKIESLPLNYHTPLLKILDHNGVELSGGQKQNIAISRALYHQGKCIILDEPTAALDALAEQKIYEHFSQLIQDKTAIFVSHRLASTKFCDKIALFDENGLKEYGTHESLYQAKGLYYQMFNVQGQYYREGKQ